MAREETLVQRAITEVLGLAGVLVLHTSAFTARGPLGTAKGVPDLLCYAEDAPGLMWGLEVKTAKGRPTPEQKRLSDAGMYAIVRSPEEAIDASKAVLERYAPTSKILRRLGNFKTA